MPKIQYLALLRGINVGGNNIIKMVALKACFEEMGLKDVSTYIQSGNVLFTSEEKNITKLTSIIEKELTKKFNYKSRIVLLTYKMLQEVIGEAPAKFGQQPDKYRYDVIFIKPPLTAKEIFQDVPIKEGVDEGYYGKHVLYFSRLISRATQSRLSKIVLLPIYQNMTIRNWNTTTKLLSGMEKLL